MVGLQNLAYGVLLLLVTVIAYRPALNGGLLWDDDAHVTKPELQSLHGLWSIWFDLGSTQQYYPMLHSAFWVEHRLWGNAVLGYHLINVLLHVTAACLVVSIAKRLSLPGALAGRLYFRPAPGVRGGCGVDLPAEDHTLGCLLSRGGAHIPAL